MAAVALVDPVKMRLPPRFLLQKIDLYREGAVDYGTCMRVPLTRAEAIRFVKKTFEPRERIRKRVGPADANCPAVFWPDSFTTETLAYKQHLWPNGMIEGTSGAVYDRGYLYYWSWMQ